MDNSTYTRAARPEEFEEIALVAARAFHNDPLMNWMGSVAHKITLPQRSNMSTSSLSNLAKGLEILFYFHHSIILSTHLVQGRIMVVVRPETEGHEKILAACLWLPPGARVDTLWIILRSKQYRTIFGTLRRPGGWGFTGLKVWFLHLQGSFRVLRCSYCNSFLELRCFPSNSPLIGCR